MVPERLTTMYNPAVGWDVWQGDPGRGGGALLRESVNHISHIGQWQSLYTRGTNTTMYPVHLF